MTWTLARWDRVIDGPPAPVPPAVVNRDDQGTRHARADGSGYQGRFEYAADRYGVVVDHLLVEDNFLPEVGFLRRDNFRRS